MQRKIHRPYVRLKAVLKENNITYKEIAIDLGISSSSVEKKINGASDFYLSEVVILQKKYGFCIEVFYT